MKIELEAIAFVKNSRKELIDDNWSSIESEIELTENIFTEAFEGIENFSHLEIIFFMNKVKDEKAIAQYRHPRNNESLPKLGTYAQRNKNRPNKLGLTTVELLERNARILKVKNLDAIDGTPILDIKPVMKQFEPKGEIKQPEWTNEILKNYWKTK
ncbi:MAG: tRNA (N6-threonylcarbamoyladenosine(37)-N6)-methyltransferase TrmO [Chitinophagales bacterium]